MIASHTLVSKCIEAHTSPRSDPRYLRIARRSSARRLQRAWRSRRSLASVLGMLCSSSRPEAQDQPPVGGARDAMESARHSATKEDATERPLPRKEKPRRSARAMGRQTDGRHGICSAAWHETEAVAQLTAHHAYPPVSVSTPFSLALGARARVRAQTGGVRRSVGREATPWDRPLTPYSPPLRLCRRVALAATAR